MSVQSELTRLSQAADAIGEAIENKGVTVPEGTRLDGMAGLIGDIEVTDLSGVTATAANVLDNKFFVTAAGVLTEGTMTNRGAVSKTLAINGSYTIPKGYHNGSGKVTQSVATKAAATYNPSVEEQTIAAGRYLSGAQTIAATTGTANVAQVLDGYTFNSGNGIGLSGTMANNGTVNKTLGINGSYTIPAGYHNGSGKVTQSIATKAAATYGPSLEDQTIAAGQYLSGAQTISKTTGTAGVSHVLDGFTFNSANGIGLTGTMANNGAVSGALSETGVYTIPEGYHDGEGTVSATLRSSSSLTASGAKVSVPAGYYHTAASKSVATATQATPSITVSAAGLITASATQTAGYVSAGTKSGTKQLTTKGAATITPSTEAQTAVAKNVYTTGAVTVAAIPAQYKDVSGTDALAAHVLAGKVFVSAESESREGTMPNNGAVSHSLAANGTYTIPEGYHNGEGTVTQSLTNRTSSSLTVSGAKVSVPAGYYAAAASKSVATATQATPSISIDSAGLITASATQTAGYVSAGTKSGTKQMTVQAAKTITPSTASQTAVAKNVYTTGAVTVAAIPSSYVKPTATQAATTYGAKTTAQTIAAGTYLSGAQTIAAVTQTNLSADNIIKGVTVTVASNGSNIFSVTGTRELPSATTATAATFKMDYAGGYSYKAATACAAYGAAVKSSTTGYVTLPAGTYRVIGFGDCDFTGTNGFWIAKQGAVSTGLAKGTAINSSYPRQFYMDTTLTLTASTTVTLVMYSATAGYGRRGAAAVFRVS